MKKQGIWVTRFVFLILFVFVMAYMGYHVISALTDPVGTVNAVLHTVETSSTLDGWFVRDEIVVPMPDGIWELQAETGQRVARDETLALTYKNAGVQRESNENRALAARIERLKAVSRSAADLVNVSELDSLILDTVIELASTCDTSTLSNLENQSVTLKSLLYKRSYTYEDGLDVNILIDTLSQQLDSSRMIANDALGRIQAPASGTFSALTDGYEHLLTPKALDRLTADEFLDITRRSLNAPASSLGKLAQGFSWYYAVVLSEAEMGHLEEGDMLSLRLDQSQELQVHVRRIARTQDGRCFLVLEGVQNMAAHVSLRRTPAQVVWDSQTGLRIPREAVRVDDKERAGVYCQINNLLKFKPVEILLERDNYYLVAYQPENNNGLLPGDEVVVRAKNLYDGKVVK